MYRKSPRKFERKFQCKIFHGRPLFVEVPKIRTSPNASFWLIWPNWDMKEMEMWPKAIMVWKYDGSRPTLQTISEVSSPGPEIWFFLQKKISDLLLTRQSNICRKKQIFVFNIMLIVWASLFFNHLCGGQRVSFGGNSVSRHTEKVENTHLLGPGVKFFSSSNARKNSFSSKIPTLPIPAPDLSWVAYLGLCIFCILPIQTFTFHFPKTNSDPLSRWPVSLWYRNNDVSPKTTGVEVGVWDAQGGATLMVCLTYENYCLILVSHLLNKS